MTESGMNFSLSQEAQAAELSLAREESGFIVVVVTKVLLPNDCKALLLSPAVQNNEWRQHLPALSDPFWHRFHQLYQNIKVQKNIGKYLK